MDCYALLCNMHGLLAGQLMGGIPRHVRGLLRPLCSAAVLLSARLRDCKQECTAGGKGPGATVRRCDVRSVTSIEAGQE